MSPSCSLFSRPPLLSSAAKHQKRDLVITTANVYNFKERNYTACQRAIPIVQLRGIVLAANSDEVLIQVQNDYDYRLLIVRQADAIRILCELYEQLTGGSKLPVVVEDDLSRVQVLKADVRMQRSRDDGAASAESANSLPPPPSPATPLSPAASNAMARSQSVSSDNAASGTPGIDMKPSMEGWLTKKGAVNLLWRRRYFRLSESNLLYYEARLKGTIELVAGGEVRAWVNKRLSMSHSGGSDRASTSGGSGSGSGVLGPLMYEYKLSTAYGLGAAAHLKDILTDPDRLAAFVAFCEQRTRPPTSSQTDVLVDTPSEGDAPTSANESSSSSSSSSKSLNESGNPKFYAAVERFKSLASAGGSATVLRTVQLAEAKAIYRRFLALDTQTPINAPTPVKEAIGDLLARQPPAAATNTHNTSTKAAKSNSAATAATSESNTAAASSNIAAADAAPSSTLVDSDLFNVAQQFAFEYLQSAVLPSYLAHSQAIEATLARDFRLKKDLDEADKKVAACHNCLATFGMLKRRHLCEYCSDIFCSACLAKTSRLPPEYGIAEPIRVCDMCFGSLEISHVHPHAFSYVNKTRSRPINLAASSPQELQAWMSAFRACIQLQQRSSFSSFLGPPAAATCQKEGWLMKEDPTTKIWRRRYFILNSTTAQLYYYELHLKGSISLAQGAGVHATLQQATLSQAESQFGGQHSRSAFGFRFNISYNTRLYALAADTEETLQRWMEALQRAIRRAKPGAGGGLHALLDKNANLLPASPAVGNIATAPNTAAAGANVLASPSGGVPSSAADYSWSFQQRAPEGEVTFVFTDVQNSTKLWERASEAMNRALEQHDALLRTLLQVFRGYEVKTEGDAFMTTFFRPEDAVRWCLACQQALVETVWPADLLRQPSGEREVRQGRLIFNGIRIRMGIHVGHPACRRNPITGRMDYFGPVVNRAARVSDSAHGGQVVCTVEVRDRLVAGIAAGEFPRTKLDVLDLGRHRYKGIPELVQVFQISDEHLAGRNPFPELRTTKADEPMPDAATTTMTTTAVTTTDENETTATSTEEEDTTTAATAAAIVDESSPSAVVDPMLITVQPPTPDETRVSPLRPSHLTVASISALSIQPYTPTAVTRAAAGGHDDDTLSDEALDAPPTDPALSTDSDDSDVEHSSEDEEDEEDQRVERDSISSASPRPPPSVDEEETPTSAATLSHNFDSAIVAADTPTTAASSETTE